MSSERILYWASGSPPCWRVMLILEEKGLEYDSRLREFSKKEHKSAEVLALNPRGQFPTFKDEDNVVNESGAAVLYLDMKYPDPPLCSEDFGVKAKILQRFFEVITFTDNLRDYVKPKFKGVPDENEAQNYQNAVAEFERWETYLSKSKYAATEEFTLADVMFIPSLMFLARFGMKFKDYPNMKRYYDLIKERPTVVKTMPPHWKESQGPMILSHL